MSDSAESLVRHRLERARETLEEAQLMFDTGHLHGATNRLYYACFYAATALLAARGLSSSKHSGVRALPARHFVQTRLISKELGAFYNDLFERRQQGDY